MPRSSAGNTARGAGARVAKRRRMKHLACLVILCATACTAADEDVTLLTVDAYYLAVFAPDTSPEDCLARPDPRGCRFAITLCSDGRAAERIGDVISDGTYELNGSIALVTLEDRSFEFDVATRVRSNDSPKTSWVLDTKDLHKTVHFDTIDCAD
jgi:hypothetical protein